VRSALPHFADLREVVETARNRPASTQYARLSDVIQRYVHETLTGGREPEDAARSIVEQVGPLLEADSTPGGRPGAEMRRASSADGR